MMLIVYCLKTGLVNKIFLFANIQIFKKLNFSVKNGTGLYMRQLVPGSRQPASE
jgi:hypothetical protein